MAGKGRMDWEDSIDEREERHDVNGIYEGAEVRQGIFFCYDTVLRNVCSTEANERTRRSEYLGRRL